MRTAVAVDFAKWCSVLAHEIETILQSEPSSPAAGTLTVLGRRRLDLVRDLVASFHNTLPRLEERREAARRRLLQRQKHRPFVILSIEAYAQLDTVPAVVLEKLSQETPTFLSQIDLITGSSSASLCGSFFSSLITFYFIFFYRF